MNLVTTSIHFLRGCKVSETFFTTGLTCLWVFGIKILVSAAFSNEIFIGTVDEMSFIERNT